MPFTKFCNLHRMKTEWKVEAEIGKLQVAYREVAGDDVSVEDTFERKGRPP